MVTYFADTEPSSRASQLPSEDLIGDELTSSIRHLLRALGADPSEFREPAYALRCDDIHVARNVPFYSLGENYLRPYFGRVQIAYTPGERLISLRKLAKSIEKVARRPNSQQRLTQRIADVLMNDFATRGVLVVVEAEHPSNLNRGNARPSVPITTSAVRGNFIKDPKDRARCYALLDTVYAPLREPPVKITKVS